MYPQYINNSVATREGDGKYADVTFDGVMEYYANADNSVLILIFIRAYVIIM
jgi:hypothetical protein